VYTVHVSCLPTRALLIVANVRKCTQMQYAIVCATVCMQALHMYTAIVHMQALLAHTAIAVLLRSMQQHACQLYNLQPIHNVELLLCSNGHHHESQFGNFNNVQVQVVEVYVVITACSRVAANQLILHTLKRRMKAEPSIASILLLMHVHYLTTLSIVPHDRSGHVCRCTTL
jgi:hypothetical protein